MPKHEFMSPKAIANRIKTKGLQKLRWYCQVCQKQCRDQNGFKCHMTSESHQRQLLLVAENPGRYIGGYSEEFLRDFLDLLKRGYGTRRVHCNIIYNEYIQNKEHIHMNATRWLSLTGFVKFLGRTGICDVEPTPKGWFIKYIDRDPETIKRQAAMEKKKQMDLDDEERLQKFIEKQIERANEEYPTDEPIYTELQKDDDVKITFSLSKNKECSATQDMEEDTSGVKKEELELDPMLSAIPPPSIKQELECKQEDGFVRPKIIPVKPMEMNVFKVAGVQQTKPAIKPQVKEEGKKRKISALEEIKMMEELRKEKKNRRENWLTKGIVVKVVNKSLGEKFYKKKGVVEELEDSYTGIVNMLDTGAKVKIDQAHLETVIPAIGRMVMVVNGAYRGTKAVLEAINTKKFSVTVKLAERLTMDRVVDGIAYEDVSKLHTR
ncbi:DNA/RNA-binding protein KIN17-like isoform X2 [Dysidea avara]|uniref:DNA/RNA-binding protein KIN17-like isoform X2 n=1 Tax=Dysidea avara TaxID=196820 RepID=UPI0033191731